MATSKSKTAAKQRPSRKAEPIKKASSKKAEGKKEEVPPRTRTVLSHVTMRQLNEPKNEPAPVDTPPPSTPLVPARHVMTEKESLVERLSDELPEGREERWEFVEHHMVAAANSTMMSGVALLALHAEMPQGEFQAELARRELPQRTCYEFMRVARSFGSGHKRIQDLGKKKMLALASEGFTDADYDPVADTIGGHPIDEIEKTPAGQVRDKLRKTQKQVEALNRQVAQAETKIAELDAIARPMPGSLKHAIKISTLIKNACYPVIRAAASNIEWRDEENRQVVDEVGGAVALVMGACYELLHKVIYQSPGARGGMGAGIRLHVGGEFITMLRLCNLPVPPEDEELDAGDRFADTAKKHIAEDARRRVAAEQARIAQADEDHEQLVEQRQGRGVANDGVIDVSAN